MEDKFKIKKILVSLDLSDIDGVLIRFSSYIARMMDSDRVYFMHIAKDLDMPEELRQEGAVAPLDENYEHLLRQQVQEFFEPIPGCETLVEVHEGNPTDRLLKLAHQKDVDLLVVGTKADVVGAGPVAEKVIKASNRSVLLVPEMLPNKMDKILVPIDFSEHSLRALRQAIKIRENSQVPLQIKCQHVYQLPSGWHTSGKSEEEFAQIMEKHAQADYQKFLSKLPAEYHDIPCVFSRDNNHDPVREIYAQAVLEQADLLMVGSRGKSAAAAALMGSVAERLASTTEGIPLLIVKDKNENIGFLKALLKL